MATLIDIEENGRQEDEVVDNTAEFRRSRLARATY
jgi:hypothetical protein